MTSSKNSKAPPHFVFTPAPASTTAGTTATTQGCTSQRWTWQQKPPCHYGPNALYKDRWLPSLPNLPQLLGDPQTTTAHNNTQTTDTQTTDTQTEATTILEMQNLHFK